MNWILGKLVELINWMADQEERKSLKQDIPSPSAQGRADAPGCFAPGTVVIYYSESRITPDRPPETGAVWGGLSVDEICRELEGRV